MSTVDEHPAGPSPTDTEPDARPLGWLAVGFALLSAVLAPTYFFSFYTFVVAVPALALGFAARGLARTRALGRAAIATTVLACAVAALMLLLAL